MFYERLENIYRESGCQEYFPSSLFQKFYDFLRVSYRNGRMYISPYKFALHNQLTVNEAIQFFMYFTVDNGIFDMVYFIDCTKSLCSNRVYLDVNGTESSDSQLDSFVTCEECEKEYEIKDIIEHVKAYFVLNTEIEEPEIQVKVSTLDPNSTFLALKRLPDHLKRKSPSSSSKTERSFDEGDEPVEFNRLVTLNQMNGKPISNSFQTTLSIITGYIRR
ncbi:hypothetical protein C8Z91_19905 [Paenibacillus elgii]|uniref:Uncharacterized protein n=1 Tax=Paenibacillus elgii TaxID=189691 RepID=A0A2T6G0B4_9BACL|nr:hypothetical protein [Paenibacillus elgii]PUA37606.1 hypothetical protein C8Z91_19905 [Paenibacillus elgii]